MVLMLAPLSPNKIKYRKWHRKAAKDMRKYGTVLDPAASHQKLGQKAHNVGGYHY
jgi:hypothetical protein